MDREKFHWGVELQAEDGDVSTYPISTYWDPMAEGAMAAVMLTAQAEACVRSGGKRYAPISARLLEEPLVA